MMCDEQVLRVQKLLQSLERKIPTIILQRAEGMYLTLKKGMMCALCFLVRKKFYCNFPSIYLSGQKICAWKGWTKIDLALALRS
jgi:hypothetical protein